MPNVDPMSLPETEPVMLDEYDFSNAVRGNPRTYLAQRSRQGLHLSSNQSANNQSTNNNERSVSQDSVVRVKTVEIQKATVSTDGTLTVQLPDTIDPGEYQITLLIHESSHA